MATFFKFKLLDSRTIESIHSQFSSQHHRGYTNLSKSPPLPPCSSRWPQITSRWVFSTSAFSTFCVRPPGNSWCFSLCPPLLVLPLGPPRSYFKVLQCVAVVKPINSTLFWIKINNNSWTWSGTRNKVCICIIWLHNYNFSWRWGTKTSPQRWSFSNQI